jgi:hypothetical protein
MNHAEYGGVEAYAEGKGENGYRRNPKSRRNVLSVWAQILP